MSVILLIYCYKLKTDQLIIFLFLSLFKHFLCDLWWYYWCTGKECFQVEVQLMLRYWKFRDLPIGVRNQKLLRKRRYKIMYFVPWFYLFAFFFCFWIDWLPLACALSAIIYVNDIFESSCWYTFYPQCTVYYFFLAYLVVIAHDSEFAFSELLAMQRIYVSFY